MSYWTLSLFFYNLTQSPKKGEMGDPLPNHPHALPSGAFTQSDDPSLERSFIKNKGRFGRVPPRSRLSQSESSGPEEGWLSPSADVTSSYAGGPVLQGVLNHRSAFEQAENGNETLSSSPRSPNTRSFFGSKAGLARGQHQNQGRPAGTIKASGTQPLQSGRGRNRTSSETEARAKRSGTATQRKRGFSETESRPMRDKYERCSREWFRHACLRLFTIVNVVSHFGWLRFLFGLFYAYLCIVLRMAPRPWGHVSLDAGDFFCVCVFFFFLIELYHLLAQRQSWTCRI